MSTYEINVNSHPVLTKNSQVLTPYFPSLQMETGVLFFESDQPYVHVDPIRDEYYIYCGEPRIRVYTLPNIHFQHPLDDPEFDPDAPYPFPLAWLHPGGPEIPQPNEPFDPPPPPELQMPHDLIPAPLNAVPPFEMDGWGVPGLAPEFDPPPEPIPDPEGDPYEPVPVEPPIEQPYELGPEELEDAPPPSPDSWSSECESCTPDCSSSVPTSGTSDRHVEEQLSEEEDPEEDPEGDPEEDPDIVIYASDGDV